MITDRYYYNRLSDKEKTIYNQVYKSIINLQSVAKVTGYIAMPTAMKIIEAITKDNPHLYYFNQTEVKIQTSTLCSEIYLSYLFSNNEIVSYNRQIEDAVNKITKKLQLETAKDEYKIEKRIHDTLASHLEYDHSAIKTNNQHHLAKAHSIVGVFVDKKAVCEGIAKAAKILLNTANVHCIVVTGKAALETNGGHAWNIVKINGFPYHLDITWDIANSTKKQINYDYFNLPDCEISKDHSDFKDVPKCSNMESNYYCKEHLVFSDIKIAKAYLKSEIKKQIYYFNIKWQSNTINIHEASETLVKFALNSAASDGYRWQVRYMVNEKQGTIRINLFAVV